MMETRILGKRDINSLTYEQIRRHIWNGVGTNELVGLTDRFTVDALFYFSEHPDWDSFPFHFKDWVFSTVQGILESEEQD